MKPVYILIERKTLACLHSMADGFCESGAFVVMADDDEEYRAGCERVLAEAKALLEGEPILASSLPQRLETE